MCVREKRTVRVMAETSEIRITLGRSGQVVKRPDSIPVKRSVRDRLGTAPPHLHNHNHKRSRVDDDDDARFSNHFPDDLHLSKHDLRFKILKRTQTTTLDLRDMLSRPPRPKLHRPTRIPHPRDLPHPHHPHHHMPDQPQHRRRMPDSTDDAHNMPQPLQVRRHDIPKLNDTRHRIPHPTNASMTRHFTTSEGPSQMDYLRSSYSPWTLDHIRRKSPDLTTSRGLSPSSPPPPRTEQTQRRPVIRQYEAPPKSVTYASREIPRPMTTTSFMPNPSLSVAPTKSVGTLVTAPLSSGGSMQRNQYPVAETLTVEGFLRSLGLEKYLISFKVEEVDMAALSQMGDHDLKEMGIPMGPRKKILLTLLARARGQAR